MTLTSLPTSPPSLPSLRHDLSEKGFCVIPQFYSPQQLSRLRAAAHAAAQRARTGNWNHVRTLPRQFPPWNADDAKEQGIWGVQHLLHPEMPLDERREFLQCYFGGALLGICLGLMRETEISVGDSTGLGAGVDSAAENYGTRGKDETERTDEDEQLVMELFNMLITPRHNFQLKWHRDAIAFQNLSVEEEAEQLGLNTPEGRRRAHHVQYNIPLYRDQSLILIPGSHRRPRTSQELELLSQDPYAPDLPGMLIVDAQPGDVIFYDNNVIHTGRYDSTVERVTLHGCVGNARGGNGRARNILQHGVGDWVEELDFEGLEAEERRRAEGMRRRLVELGKGVGAEGRKAVFDE
ncbi:MAG: hypothetical protein Q9162_000479 [Coniocarpon cinnabarinum]